MAILPLHGELRLRDGYWFRRTRGCSPNNLRRSSLLALGAPGNLKTEHLIPDLNSKGCTTGIDYRKLPTIALSLGIALGQHTVRSDTLHP